MTLFNQLVTVHERLRPIDRADPHPKEPDCRAEAHKHVVESNRLHIPGNDGEHDVGDGGNERSHNRQREEERNSPLCLLFFFGVQVGNALVLGLETRILHATSGDDSGAGFAFVVPFASNHYRAGRLLSHNCGVLPT